MAFRQFFPVFLSLLLAGCDRDPSFSGLATAPPLPPPMQGDWIFSESATVAHMEQSMSAAQLAEQRKMRSVLKGMGHAMGTDIRIKGNTIIGTGAMIEPRFDLTSWSKTGAIITGRAWHHEDRHDPGDMHEIDVKLQIVANELWFDMGDEGVVYRMVFIRIPEPK